MATVQIIGSAFVDQYYRILKKDQELLYKFYTNASAMFLIDGNSRESASSLKQIQTLIRSLSFTEIDIKTTHSLESWKGGVLVMVSGSVQTKDFSGRRKFMQTFFLAPQEKGYFVLNDIFHFIDEEGIQQHPAALLGQNNLDSKLNAVSSLPKPAKKKKKARTLVKVEILESFTKDISQTLEPDVKDVEATKDSIASIKIETLSVSAEDRAEGMPDKIKSDGPSSEGKVVSGPAEEISDERPILAELTSGEVIQEPSFDLRYQLELICSPRVSPSNQDPQSDSHASIKEDLATLSTRLSMYQKFSREIERMPSFTFPEPRNNPTPVISERLVSFYLTNAAAIQTALHQTLADRNPREVDQMIMDATSAFSTLDAMFIRYELFQVDIKALINDAMQFCDLDQVTRIDNFRDYATSCSQRSSERVKHLLRNIDQSRGSTGQAQDTLAAAKTEVELRNRQLATAVAAMTEAERNLEVQESVVADCAACLDEARQEAELSEQLVRQISEEHLRLVEARDAALQRFMQCQRHLRG
ncbi:hypothetical protein HHK36_022474 [Tetracentron sinense]|uniref:NTF2 domain-containing protein n=1 Tax=Tetracentron sinense TaxID=13715 RepID=A0A835D8V5_TETSI|nr:hypothetical protein HHK36_022474 [Tetracentron sinense]